MHIFLAQKNGVHSCSSSASSGCSASSTCGSKSPITSTHIDHVIGEVAKQLRESLQSGLLLEVQRAVREVGTQVERQGMIWMTNKCSSVPMHIEQYDTSPPSAPQKAEGFTCFHCVKAHVRRTRVTMAAKDQVQQLPWYVRM